MALTYLGLAETELSELCFNETSCTFAGTYLEVI
jgi:hypothetical protein